MPSEVEIVVKATDKSSEGFAETGKSLAELQERISSATEKGQEGFDKVDTGAMGFRDTITGVQDTMTGFQALMGQGSMASATLGDKLFGLGAGIGDLASGFVNLIIPLAGSVAALSAQAAAEERSVAAMLAHRVATIASAAASGVMTAAQWLLNAAMDANPIMLIVIAIAALAAGLVYAYQHSETFRTIVQAIGSFFTGVLWPALEKVGGYLKDVFGPAFTAVGQAISGTWGFLKGLVGADDDASDSTKKLKETTDAAKKAADDHAAALKKESDAAATAAGTALGLMGAEDKLAAAEDDAAKAVKENGKGLDVHTEKGRNNRTALENLASAANDSGKAVLDAGGSQLQAAQKMDEGRQAFIRAATQMGLTKGQALALANQLIAIPKSIQPAIKLTGVNESIQDVINLRNTLAQLQNKTVYINEIRNTSGGTAPGGGGVRAMGGIIGAMGGGPRSGRIRVGEYGPEDIDLAPGSTVHTASDSPAGGGGAGGAVRLLIDTAGSRMDDLLLELLRNAIRVRGGDVQVVLGR